MANEINMNLEEFQQRERAASLMADELATLRAENESLKETLVDHGEIQHALCEEITELKRQRDEYEQQNVELLRITLMMRDWIDAVPQDTELPAMPGFDRDWANSIIDAAIKGANGL